MAHVHRLDRHDAARSRVSAVADATGALRDLLGQVEDTALDPDGLLMAAARALLAVVSHSPDAELCVSAGPDHRWHVRVVHDADGITARIGSGERPGPPADGPRTVVTELADLLRHGPAFR